MGGRIRHERRNARRAALGPRAQGWIGGGQPKRGGRRRDRRLRRRSRPTAPSCHAGSTGSRAASAAIGAAQPPHSSPIASAAFASAASNRGWSVRWPIRVVSSARASAACPAAVSNSASASRISLPARHGRRPPQIADCRGVIALRECTKMGFVQQRRVSRCQHQQRIAQSRGLRHRAGPAQRSYLRRGVHARWSGIDGPRLAVIAHLSPDCGPAARLQGRSRAALGVAAYSADGMRRHSVIAFCCDYSEMGRCDCGGQWGKRRPGWLGPYCFSRAINSVEAWLGLA